jgi:hypothetical protein
MIINAHSARLPRVLINTRSIITRENKAAIKN